LKKKLILRTKITKKIIKITEKIRKEVEVKIIISSKVIETGNE
jgi:hypothetical protein